MSAPGDPVGAALVPLAELLLAVRRELVGLHAVSVDAQAVLGAAVARGGLGLAECRRAQAFDLVSQRLEGLATVLSGLAGTVPAGWRVDPRPVVAGVALSALVRMVSGGSGAAVADDIELF